MLPLKLQLLLELAVLLYYIFRFVGNLLKALLQLTYVLLQFSNLLVLGRYCVVLLQLQSALML